MARYLLSLSALILAGCISSVAMAHTSLVTSEPAQAAVLKEAPSSVSLVFNEAIRLTAVTIDSTDGTGHQIGPLPATAQAKFALTAPPLGPGRHEVRWRGIGADGHVVSGIVRFSIAR